MRKLVLTTAARRQIIEIGIFVADQSQRPELATNIIARMGEQCSKLSTLPGTLGRPRPELAPDLRSFPFRGYVIFFRYLPDTVEIVAVLHGHRDVIAYFDDDAGL
ncbi:type II toxin-antitoxin system RelE/ParE family toxin [Paradevosia shaoguanensis]|uniref:type II toxin-antitoxin system RelE/ParE family toxin n=1 Tax=Paradevosia shaoguanensis TaxID=1335043 RepID=UPI003C724C33